MQVAAVRERAALAEAAARRGGRGRGPGAAAAELGCVDDTRAPPRCRPSARRAHASCSPRRRSSSAVAERGPDAGDRLVRDAARAAPGRDRARRASPSSQSSRLGSKSPVPLAVETLVRTSPVSREQQVVAEREIARRPQRPRPRGAGSSRASTPDGGSSPCAGGSPPRRARAARRRARSRHVSTGVSGRSCASTATSECQKQRDRKRVALADLREHGAAGVDEVVGVEVVVGELRVARLRAARRRRRRRRAPTTSRRRARRSRVRRDLLRARAEARRGSRFPRRPPSARRSCRRAPRRSRARSRGRARCRESPARSRSTSGRSAGRAGPARASGMPMPVSATSITALSPSTNVRTVTVPPAGVNLSAFESRLPTSCERRSRSPRTAATSASSERESISRGCARAPPTTRPRRARSRHVDVREVQLQAARVEPGDEEQVADQALQPLGAAVDDREEALLLVVQLARLALADHLEEAHHRRQRRPELMRDGRDEIVLQPVELALLA